MKILRQKPDMLPDISVSGSNALAAVSPDARVIFALFFIILIVSFGRYDLTGTGVFALLAFLLAQCCLGGRMTGKIFLRVLAAMPFVVCAGLANCFFDRSVHSLGGWELNGGTVALIVMMLKTAGAAGMALILAFSTPFDEISGVLCRWHVPPVLVLQLELMFRYISVLSGEGAAMVKAYFLRSNGLRRIRLADFGTLAGGLFLKSHERSKNVYAAMQCRLFEYDRSGRCGGGAFRAGEGSWKKQALLIFCLVLLGMMRYFL